MNPHQLNSKEFIEENMAAFPIFMFETTKKHQRFKGIYSLQSLMFTWIFWKQLYRFIFQATVTISNLKYLI